MPHSELLTAKEMAILLRVRPETIKLWGREGRIPRVEISEKTIRYDAAEVIQYLRNRLQRQLDQQRRDVKKAAP